MYPSLIFLNKYLSWCLVALQMRLNALPSPSPSTSHFSFRILNHSSSFVPSLYPFLLSPFRLIHYSPSHLFITLLFSLWTVGMGRAAWYNPYTSIFCTQVLFVNVPTLEMSFIPVIKAQVITSIRIRTRTCPCTCTLIHTHIMVFRSTKLSRIIT